MSRSPAHIARLVVEDVTTNRGRRTSAALRRRADRLRERVLPVPRDSDVGTKTRVYSVPFGPAAQSVLDLALSDARRRGVRYMLGAGSNGPVVHVEQYQVEVLAQCFVKRLGSRPGYIRVRGKWRRNASRWAASRALRARDPFDILVVEEVVEGDVTHHRCSCIEFMVWAEHVGAYNSTYFETERELPMVRRLRERTFHDYMANHHDFRNDFPTPDQPTFDIDIVYTWVDGDDPAWLEQKEKAQREAGRAVADRVVHSERFRSRDELKYSLRSIDLFAPWVRKIHIVTADQTPAWLDTSNPKINLVSHRDIYANPDWLPTFNSSGIETQLHRVPGLSRYFLYFNDDFFLGQLTTPSDFFLPNGILKYFSSDQRAYEPDIDSRSEEYIQADRNAIELFKQKFDSVGRNLMSHIPYPSDRELIQEMNDAWPEAFAACAAAKFRSGDDLRPIAFMQYHYGYQVGRALPGSISHRYLALWKESIVDQLGQVAASRRYKTFCINDVGLQPERTDEINAAVVDFLDSYFPTPSSFERRAEPR